jgi:hypothetical protein
MKKLDEVIASTRQLAPPRGHRGAPMSRADWERAVGVRVAARTEPYRLERRVLYVRAATAAWANELAMLSEPIVEHLRAQGMALDAVRFVVGRVEPPSALRRAAPDPAPPPLDSLPAALEELVRTIAVPELRRAVAAAARRHLAQAADDERSPDPARRGRSRARPSGGADAAPTAGRSTGGAQRPQAPDRAAESPTPPPASETRLVPSRPR